MLKATALYPETREAVAVELHGDVYSSTVDRDGLVTYHEENKNYADSTSFSLNSDQILNTLVSFLDCWIYNAVSANVRFGFYTPNGYGKESNTDNTRNLGVTWPDVPVLHLLEAAQLDDPLVVKDVRAVVTDAYRKQSEIHATAKPTDGLAPSSLTHLPRISKWPDSQWLSFLKQIEWKFREDDANTIEQVVIDAVQASPHYNAQLAGREHHVVALLMDLLDKRQSQRDTTQRLVHVSEAVLIFKEVESGEVKIPDPAWQLWRDLPPPSDSRNLADKITSICPDATAYELSTWSRRAAQSLLEQRTLGDNKDVLALKYQVFDACLEVLTALVKAETQRPLPIATMAEWMGQLCETAKQRFDDCSRQYTYPLKADASIKALVFALFDSCFLSFDKGQSP